MRNNKSSPPLDSVDRALQLVLALREGRILSVTSAAEQLDVAPSTAHRLLSSLVFRDFAVQDRQRSYRAGPELTQPTDDRFSIDTLREAATPAMARLHVAVGDTVQLMRLDGAYIQFLDGIESTEALRVAVRIGDRMPAYCSAGGKAMLAEIGSADFERIHRGKLVDWPTAKITTMTALKRQLAIVRKVGYGVNFDETEEGVSGLGVCIHDPQGNPVGAFTAAIPSARFRKENAPHLVKALWDAAAVTEERLLLTTGRAS